MILFVFKKVYYSFKSSFPWIIETLICLISLFPFSLGLFLGPTEPWSPLYCSFNLIAFHLSLHFRGCGGPCDHSGQDGVQETTICLSEATCLSACPLCLSFPVHYFSESSLLPESVEALRRGRRAPSEALLLLNFYLSMFCKSFLFLFSWKNLDFWRVKSSLHLVSTPYSNVCCHIISLK